MIEYRYVIQYKDGSCLYLSDDGPKNVPMEFLKQLRDDDFKYAEEHSMGENMLRILKRERATGTSVGAVVRTDPYTGQKFKS